LTAVPHPIAQLWDKLLYGFLLLAGIYGIVYGLTASTFISRSLGWMPGREREEFSPRWEFAINVLIELVQNSVYRLKVDLFSTAECNQFVKIIEVDANLLLRWRGLIDRELRTIDCPVGMLINNLEGGRIPKAE
jgi:hypothetical protein